MGLWFRSGTILKPLRDAEVEAWGLFDGVGVLGGVFRNICKRDRIHVVYGCETVRSVGYLCLLFFRHRFTRIYADFGL